jgi:serine/threonine-protein kinase
LLELADGDPALKAALAELLALESEVGTFLEDSGPVLPHGLLAEIGSASGLKMEALQPGTVVGRYRIMGVLGRGGTSTVYEAERADGRFEQTVALKLLHREGPGVDLATRLRTEQRILARLAHPNLAKVFDADVAPDGRPYMVVERIRGGSITEHADARTLSVRARIELFIQVARAVHFAHRNLVVHRDLKPSNILVTEDGYVKLLDFGVAKILEADSDSRDDETVTRWMTPRYAAPEQILGRPVTTATDVHALGVILYELLAGSRPFGEETDTRYRIERAICESEPRPPSATVQTSTRERDPARVAALRGTEPERLRRTLGGDLDAVVLKALRKEPDRRYASAEAMAEDLERFLAGLPVEARGGAVAYRVGKFVRRHWLGTAAAVVGFMALAGGATALAVQQAATARERDRANAAAAEARREAENAQVAIDFLGDVFRGRNPSQAPNDTVTALELVEWGEDRALNELVETPEVQSRILGVLGQAYTNLGYSERAVAILDSALVLRRAVYGEASEPVAELLGRKAGALRQERDFDGALAAGHERLRVQRALLPAAHPDLAAALISLGSDHRDRGVLDSASLYVTQGLEILESHRDTMEWAYVDAQLKLAYVERAAGKLAEAEALYRAGLPRYRALNGEDGRDLPVHLNNLAFVLKEQGKLADASETYQAALDAMVELFGRGHPNTILVANNLAGALELMGDAEAVDRVRLESVQAARSQWAGDHWRVASALSSLGTSRLRMGRVAEAGAPLEDAVEMYRRILGREHDWTVLAEADLGVHQLLTGQGDSGRTALDAAHRRIREWSAAGESGRIEYGGVQSIQRLAMLLDEAGLSNEAQEFWDYLPEDFR